MSFLTNVIEEPSPERGAEMAAAFTRALGQDVRYNAVSPDVYGGLGRDGVSLAIRPSTHAQARARACAGARHFRAPAAAYGRHLLNERGANPRDVQALLDHKSIATTAHYTRVDSQRLRSLVGNPGCPPKVLFFPTSQARPERVSQSLAARLGRSSAPDPQRGRFAL